MDRGKSNVALWGALLGGGALLAYGISRRRAAKGPLLASSTVTVNAGPEQVYSFWREFENLPRFMHHLKSVKSQAERSQWKAVGPGGIGVSWEAEIVADRPNELISWRSLPGSTVQVDGSVEFTRATGDRGTQITAIVMYEPPAGAAGRAVAMLFGKDPSFMMEQDLRRFKALIEAGEIPTVEGQSHGPRSLVGHAAKAMDPDRGAGRKATAREDVGRGRRRVS
jgi:uncharacterized membrane protein